MDYLTSLINSYFHEPHASLMNGILLGRPLFVTRTFYEQLKEVGLIHIVVLSGMNITMLSAIVMNTTVGYLGRRIASFLTIILIVAFVQFVGAEAPVVRAAVMGILSLIGLLYGRKTLALYALFLSGTIMILLNHEWLTSISFQLSFGATLGIILFGTGEKELHALSSRSEGTGLPAGRGISHAKGFLDVAWNDIATYFIEELRISLAAQVFTLPLIFWYFRQISLIAPLANILIAWLIAPIMVLGMITVALGSLNWHLGFVCSWLVYPLLHGIVVVVKLLSQVPFASVLL